MLLKSGLLLAKQTDLMGQDVKDGLSDSENGLTDDKYFMPTSNDFYQTFKNDQLSNKDK